MAEEHVPKIDPTANVLALVAAGNKRQDDLREQQVKHDEKMDALRSDFQEKLATAESKRIDAILTGFQSAMLLANDKLGAQITTLANSIQERLMTLEKNQYQSGGASVQRNEGQLRNQWVIGLVITIALAVVAVVAHFWGAK